MLGKPITYNGITINDRQFQTLMVAPYYYIHVQSVDGLLGADISYESHPIPQDIGEISGDVFRRAKTITLSGEIFARGLAELYEGAFKLEQLMADRDLKPLIFTPWNYGIQMYVNCRPYQDLSIVMQMSSYDYRWPFTFGLRADDPRTRKVSDSSVFPTWQE